MERLHEELGSFGERNFGGAKLGDRRRVRALVRCADQARSHPEGTLPQKFARPPLLKAFYRLMNSPQVTHETLLADHRRATLERMERNPGVTLIVHDSTELDYSGLKSLKGKLGPIGNGSRQGFICHNTLAIDAERRETLGLLHQQLHRRRKVKRGETRSQVRKHPQRESRLWKRGSEAVPPAPSGRLWVEISDRGADLTEYLDHLHAQDKRYITRCHHNRRIKRREGEAWVDDKLQGYARSLPLEQVRQVDVPAHEGRPARTASLGVAFAEVSVQPPRQPCGDERGVALTLYVVRVAEVDPPPGATPIEWVLLTNLDVPALGPWQIGEWYGKRWTVEELHKAMKTGVGVEQLQFTTPQALEPAIAFLSVVAVDLLQLRDAARAPDAATRLARDFVPVMQVIVLSLWRFQTPRSDLTVKEYYEALARLGGHQNRRNDPLPGWIVLWRGWIKLQTMLQLADYLNLERCG